VTAAAAPCAVAFRPWNAASSTVEAGWTPLLLQSAFLGSGLTERVLPPAGASDGRGLSSIAGRECTASAVASLTGLPLPLEFGAVLGAGKRGKVTAVSDPRSGSTWALKQQPWDDRVAAELDVARRVAAWRCTALAPAVAIAHDETTAFTLMPQLGAQLTDCVLPTAPLPTVSQLMDLAQQLCAALATLHLHGYLFCDLHPGNVLVRSQRSPLAAAGSPGDWGPHTATLVDFGSAVALGSDATYRGPTRGGLWSVMPPEQFGPDKWGTGPVVLTPACDVYACCAVLAWAAAGGGPLPFEPLPSSGRPAVKLSVPACLGDNPRRRWSPAEWADHITRARAAAAGSAAPAHELPRPWCEALGRGLAFDAAGRWQSADDLLLALADAAPVGSS
jgi:serine/threonine protein kinase